MADQKDIKPDISSLIPNRLLGSRSGILGSKLGASASRLPSFKAPRDLTLSSAAIAMKPQLSRPKKTYMPNIVIKKEKNEKLPESKSEKSLKRSPFKGRQQGRGGKFIKKEKEFIQTRGSLFGEGIGAAPLKRQSFSTGARGGKEQSFIQRPVLNHSASANIDKDLEEKKRREILRDDFIDDPDDDDDDMKKLSPIRLPMIATIKVFKEDAKASERIVKDEDTCLNLLDLRIKEEPADGEVTEDLQRQLSNIQLQNNNKIKTSQEPSETSIGKLLSETSNDIMFFQLPSCLPGHPPDVKQEPGSHNAAQRRIPSSIEAESDGSKLEQEKCTLSSLPEGRVGTLKVYESGKTELWLGDHKLIINKGTQVGFLQDVIRMDTDKETKTGSLSVLGHIEHRLVCIPDFKSMAQRNYL